MRLFLPLGSIIFRILLQTGIGIWLVRKLVPEAVEGSRTTGKLLWMRTNS